MPSYEAGRAHVSVSPDMTGFQRKINTQIRAMNPELKIVPELDNGAMTRLRQQVRSMADVKIKVDLDGGLATASRLKGIEELCDRLDGRKVRIKIDVDGGAAALAQVAALRAALDGLSDRRIRISGLDDGATSARRLNGQLNHTKVLIGAIAAAIPLVSSALVALPGLVSPLASSAGAVAVGFDGIKKSVKDLEPAFNDMRKSVSGVFEKELAPAISDINRMMPALQKGLEGSASSTSRFASAITGVVASESGLERINRTFTRSNDIMDLLAPGTALFADNLIRLADEGTAALIPMTGEMTRMSEAWEDTIDRMSRTGELESGIQGLVQVLGSLGTMVPAVVELGNAMTGALGPTVASALDLTTAGVRGTTEAFRLIPGPVNDGVIAVGGFVLAMKGLTAIMGTAAVTSRIVAMSTALNSAAVNAALASQRMGAFGAALGPGAVAGLQGTATAIQRIGAAIPVLGAAIIGGALAWDKFTISQDEAEQKLLTTGISVDELAKSMANQNQKMEDITGAIPVLGSWLVMGGDYFGLFGKSVGEVEDDLNEFLATLSPLEKAQMGVRGAQLLYNQAVHEHGPTSEQARRAGLALADAQRKVNDETFKGTQLLKDNTKALFDQVNQMLAAADARLAEQSGLLAIESAQKAYNDAVREHGPASLEARQADIAYQQTLNQQIGLARDAALANYENKDSLDAQRAATAAANDEIFRLASTTGGVLPPELAKMAAGLDASYWAAHGAKLEFSAAGEVFAKLPDGKTIRLDADKAEFDRAMAEVQRREYWVTVKAKLEQAGGWSGLYGNPTPGGATGGGIRNGRIVHRAPGGPVVGPGTGTSDSIPAMGPGAMYRLSNGEWIMTAAAVAGAGGFAGMAALMAALEGSRRRAAGGPVGSGSNGAGLAISGSMDGALPLTPDALQELTSGLKNLLSGALQPLVEQVQGSTNPVLQALQDRITAGAKNTQVATGQEATAHRGLTATVQQTTAAQIAANLANSANLNTATAQMQAWISRLQAASNASWFNMQQVTGQNVGTITGPIFGGLNAGMANVQTIAGNTAAVWTQQLNSMRAAAADPIRWIMQFPLGEPGIAKSWNELDRQFALGKQITMPAPGFASGGHVTGPGSGTSDSIMARLSAGEFVVREKVASMVPHFLKALNAGQPEAIQAAGGRKARMPGFAAGGAVVAVERAKEWARSQAGKRYVWGGVGPGGYDCSGWQSAITNVLRNQYPHRRLGNTASFPWSGFRPGLGGAYAIGSFTGNPGHMAGTLGGVNVEAGGRHNTNAYGGPAVGADHPQFRTHGFLPEIGGVFAPGGGGGGFFDPGPLVDAAFKRTYDLINEITARFGMSNIVTGLQSISRQAADAVKGKAMEKLAASVGPGAGGGVERWRGMVHRALAIAGQPMSMDNITLRRMNQESGGNPTAVNLWDSNAASGNPSVGLMQVIRGTYASYKHPQFDMGPYMHGVSVDPLANTLASMRYALGRYGSLPAAYNRPGGYDQGGWLQPGITQVYNGTSRPEAVLTSQQWRVLAADRGNTYNTFHLDGQRQFTARDLLEEIDFETRRKGVHT